MRIAIIMSGGDAPGMNAFLCSVSSIMETRGITPVYISGGYQGILNRKTVSLDSYILRSSMTRAGSLLQTGRCAAFVDPAVRMQAIQVLRSMSIDGLIVCGGNGSLTGAKLLSDTGFPTIGVPVTIDGDVFSTETAIGFASAAQAIVDNIASLNATGHAYPNRVFLTETLGGKKGYLALVAGLAANADMILVPEASPTPESAALHVAKILEEKDVCVGVVCEGSLPDWKNGDQNCIPVFSARIEELSHVRTRYSILGYGLRGLRPIYEDCLLASSFAIMAVDGLCEGKSGMVTASVDGKLILNPIDPSANGFPWRPYMQQAILSGKIPQ